MSNSRKKPPAGVTRMLRQEAGFGCAKCGFPFVEYHHIVPWEEEEHYRPEDMVVLCPTCHASVRGMSRAKQYEIKKNPENIRRNRVKGVLVHDGGNSINIGSNCFLGSPLYVCCDGKPILAYGKSAVGEYLVYAKFQDERGEVILDISANEFEFTPDILWDFEFKFNYVLARNEIKKVFFELDLRKEQVEISANFRFGNKIVSMDSQKLEFSSVSETSLTQMKANVFNVSTNEPCIHFISDSYLSAYGGQGPSLILRI